MGDVSVDEILDKLVGIGLNKRYMNPKLRGWVNVLGLNVRLREGGRRLLAGGSLRDYVHAKQSEDGDWELVKFDLATWNRRFASILDATYEISDYLFRYADGDRLYAEFSEVFSDHNSPT